MTLPTTTVRTAAAALLTFALVFALTGVMASCGADTATTSRSVTTTVGGPASTATSGSGGGGAATTLATRSGENLFAVYCAGCHGNDGKSKLSKSLVGAQADDIKQAIDKGKGSMPAFAGRFSQEEVDAITAYIATLK